MAVEVLNFGRFIAKTALAVIIVNQRQHMRVIGAMLEIWSTQSEPTQARGEHVNSAEKGLANQTTAPPCCSLNISCDLQLQ